MSQKTEEMWAGRNHSWPGPNHLETPVSGGNTHDISYKCSMDEYLSAVLIYQSCCTLGEDKEHY